MPSYLLIPWDCGNRQDASRHHFHWVRLHGLAGRDAGGIPRPCLGQGTPQDEPAVRWVRPVMQGTASPTRLQNYPPVDAFGLGL